MRLKAFNSVFSCMLAVSGFHYSGSAVAGLTLGAGIPVECAGCENATREASSVTSNSIIDAIRLQTETIVNAMEYVMRMQATFDTSRRKSDERINQNYALNPALGAKPRAACGHYGAAGVRAASTSAATEAADTVMSSNRQRNQRGRQLAPGEPRREYSVKEVLTAMDQEDYSGVNLVMKNSPVDASDKAAVTKALAELQLITNPFPVEEPSQTEIERIKSTGTPGEKERIAQAVVMARRQEIGQYPIAENFTKNQTTIELKGALGTPLQNMWNEMKESLDANDPLVKQMATGRMSPNQLDQLVSTYRINSPKWVLNTTASASALGLQKDQTLMQAEMLNQMWLMNQKLGQLLNLAAMSDIREVTQGGLQSR